MNQSKTVVNLWLMLWVEWQVVGGTKKLSGNGKEGGMGGGDDSFLNYSYIGF